MLVIPKSSPLYKTFHDLAQASRCIFLAGIPGTGKSLYIQQLAHIAAELGRRIHLLQWDVSRMAFETDEVIQKYPEIDGVTDPAIRKGFGLWARDGVLDWHKAYPSAEHLLIGEVPLVGNRLIELAQIHQDEAEPLLAGEETQFLISVPSLRVRQAIKDARARSIEIPSHVKEEKDAPPNVMQLNWVDTYQAAVDLGLAPPDPHPAYDPAVYEQLYLRLLNRRHAKGLVIDEILKPVVSVYEMNVVESELAATADQAQRLIRQVELDYSREELITAVNHWHHTI